MKITIPINPLKFSHGSYEEYVKTPPSGIEYEFLKDFNDLNSLKVLNSNSDLIEAGDKCVVNNKKWIISTASFTQYASFDFFGNYMSRNFRVELLRKIMLKDNLKKIVFKSQYGFDTLKTYGNIKDKEILEKCCVVYPAMSKVDVIKKKHDGFNILIVGSDFIRKGGKQLIDAFEKLQIKFDNINLIIVSHFNELNSRFDPFNQKNAIYKRIIKNHNIKITGHIKREEVLNNYFPYADVFIFPTMEDTTPFTLNEAIAFGLPIISSDIYSMPEMFKDNQNSLLINIKDNEFYRDLSKFRNSNDKYEIPNSLNETLFNGIYEKLKLLIEDSSLRKRLSKNVLNDARTKFSIISRNKLIKSIYEESI